MSEQVHKKWIIEFKNLVRVVICPYCGKQSPYPYDTCEYCHNVVAFPDEAKVVKHEWW